MSVNLPYNQGSKGLLIAQHMLEKGLPDDVAEEKKFVRELSEHYKVNEKTIRNVKSVLKHMNLLKSKVPPASPVLSSSLETPPSDNPSGIKEKNAGIHEGSLPPQGSVGDAGKGDEVPPRKASGGKGENFRVVAAKNPLDADDNGLLDVRNDMERMIFVEASPILKKVALNPKVYLWYDYAKTELGFKGDVGDFLIDTVEDFFRSRGYRIVISQTKEVGY